MYSIRMYMYNVYTYMCVCVCECVSVCDILTSRVMEKMEWCVYVCVCVWVWVCECVSVWCTDLQGEGEDGMGARGVFVQRPLSNGSVGLPLHRTTDRHTMYTQTECQIWSFINHLGPRAQIYATVRFYTNSYIPRITQASVAKLPPTFMRDLCTLILLPFHRINRLIKFVTRSGKIRHFGLIYIMRIPHVKFYHPQYWQ